MNHVWLAVLAGDTLRQSVGIRYVSHLWDDYPYWHLWFRDRGGVYRLELKEATRHEDYDWVAAFLIKYYPAATEAAFQGLSALERLLRGSDVFDSSPGDGRGGCACHGHSNDDEGTRFQDLVDGCGVPDVRYGHEIPADFFFAGHLSVAHRVDVGTVITAKSQTFWRVEMTEDYVVRGSDQNSVTVLRKGSVDRNYPGQDITEFVYRRFTEMWRAVHQGPIARDEGWMGDGVLFKTDGLTLSTEIFPSIRRIIRRTTITFQPGVCLVPPRDEDTVGMEQDFSNKEV